MSATLAQIPMKNIDPPTSNPRVEASDLDELVESIRGVGILEPLIGVVSGPERVRLVAGLRRFSAAKIVGLTRVPMLVYGRMSEREELAVSLVENLHRRDMTPIETGDAFLKLGETGMTHDQIARMVGVSIATVSKLATVARKCCPEVREACHRGDISASFAFDLTRFPPSTQRSLLASREREVARRPKLPGRQSSGAGRGIAEAALRSALKALAARDRALAIDLTQQALAALRREEQGPLRLVAGE